MDAHASLAQSKGQSKRKRHATTGLQPAEPSEVLGTPGWEVEMTLERWQGQAGRPFMPSVTWSPKGFLMGQIFI